MKSPSSRLSPRRVNRRGIALMMALLTLFMMISLAVPYSFMTSHQESAMVGYKDRRAVRDGAMSSLALGKSHLRRYHRLRQFANWADIVENSSNGEPSSLFNHLHDGLDERSINVTRVIANDYGVPAEEFNTRDPQGKVWSARIEDEQGKININTAPPDLLGNIFGSAIVNSTDDTGSGYDIEVQDGANHFPKADGKEKGYFVISGVLCSYQERRGNTFYNCVMVSDPIETLSPQRLGRTRNKEVPIFFTSENARANPENLKWVDKGHLMIPVAAHLVAYWRLMGDPDNTLEPFSHVDQVRQVAELPLLRRNQDAGLEVAPECFAPAHWARARSNLTVHSRGPLSNGFSNLHLGTIVQPATEDSPTDIQTTFLRRNPPLNNAWLSRQDARRGRGAGTARGRTIRIRYPTTFEAEERMGDAAYGLVLSGRFGVALASPYQIPEERDNILIDVQEITPININTASREVIIANLKGLRSGTVFVSHADAALIADAVLYLRYRDVAPPNSRFSHLDGGIAGTNDTNSDNYAMSVGNLRDVDEFVSLVSLLTKEHMGEAGLEENIPGLVAYFLRSPSRPLSLSHAPFIFHSYGAYTVRGHATLHALSGVEIARAGMAEVVQAGTDVGETYADGKKLRWEWRDREYLLKNSELLLGSVMRVADRPITLGEQSQRLLGVVELPWILDSQMQPRPRGTFHPASAGNAIWWLNRDPGIRGNRIRPSFVRSLGHSLQPDDSGHYGQIAEGGGVAVGELLGGSLEFWYRVPLRGLDSNEEIIFDMGLEDDTNRLSLIWWSPGSPAASGTSVSGAYPAAHALADDLPALALRIADRTLQEAHSIVLLKPAAGRWEPGEWVFLRAAWKGTDLGQLSLLADSMARAGDVGHPAARQDQVVLSRDTGGPPVWVSQTATLTAPLAPDAVIINIEPERALGFPEQGVVKIGAEAIEYRTRSNNGVLGDLTRGARGTVVTAQTMLAGTRVGMWGYESQIIDRPDAPFLPQGGGSLLSAVDGNGRYRIVLNEGDQTQGHLYPEYIGPTASFAPDAEHALLNLKGVDSNPGTRAREAIVYIRGQAWRGYDADPDSGYLVPNYAKQGEPSRLARVVIRNGQPPEITINNIIETYAHVRLSANGYQVLHWLERNQAGQLSRSSDQDGWYFMAGPDMTANGSDYIVAGGYEHSGSIVIVCSLLANTDGAYLDPATTPQLVRARRARVQVATSYIDESVSRPYFDWITYNDLYLTQGLRLFTYTDSGRLRTEANRLQTTLQSAETAQPQSMGMREWPSGGAPHRLPSGAGINPVFALRGIGSGSRIPAGTGDRVTLLWEVNANGTQNVNYRKSSAILSRTEVASPTIIYSALWTDRMGTRFARIHHSYYNNVNQFVSFERQQSPFTAITAKVIKFPEPRLPRGIPMQMRFGGVATATHTADVLAPSGAIDELRYQQFSIANLYLISTLDPVARTLIMNANPGNGEVGLIKVNDEYISYNGVQQQSGSVTLLNLVRGVLGTQATAHHVGSKVFNLAGVPVFRTSNSISPTQAILPLTGSTRATPYGFLRVENGVNARYNDMEIIGYNRLRGSTFTSGLFRPFQIGGLFRGAYGTEKREWGQEAVFIQMPVRYPDYMPKHMRDVDASVMAGTEVAHFEGREALPNSRVGVLRWQMDTDGASIPEGSNIDPYRAKLVFRFNPNVDWSSKPVVLQGGGKQSRLRSSARINRRELERWGKTADNGLFAIEFDWQDAEREDDAGLPYSQYMVDLAAIAPDLVDAFEWRLYISYNDGAYANDRYKVAPRMRGLSLEVESETRVLRHEETR